MCCYPLVVHTIPTRLSSDLQASDRHLLKVGRYSGLGLSLAAAIFALSIDNVLHAFLFTETIAAFIGIIFLCGISWKRGNRYGAMESAIVSLGSYDWYYVADVD